MRYRLRTLMIALAIGPIVLAGYYFLVTKNTTTLGLILSFPLAIVTVVLIFVLPLLALDWLLKKTRRLVSSPAQ